MAIPIVILYARPFYENGGLTMLKEYANFSASENPAAFSENHDRMLKTRCRLIAHLDIPGSQELIGSQPGFERTDFLTVQREINGSFVFDTESLFLDVVSSPAIPKLLAFQLSRISHQLADAAERILGRRAKHGETYRLINRESRRSGIE